MFSDISSLNERATKNENDVSDPERSATRTPVRRVENMGSASAYQAVEAMEEQSWYLVLPSESHLQAQREEQDHSAPAQNMAGSIALSCPVSNYCPESNPTHFAPSNELFEPREPHFLRNIYPALPPARVRCASCARSRIECPHSSGRRSQPGGPQFLTAVHLGSDAYPLLPPSPIQAAPTSLSSWTALLSQQAKGVQGRLLAQQEGMLAAAVSGVRAGVQTVEGAVHGAASYVDSHVLQPVKASVKALDGRTRKARTEGCEWLAAHGVQAAVGLTTGVIVLVAAKHAVRAYRRADTMQSCALALQAATGMAGAVATASVDGCHEQAVLPSPDVTDGWVSPWQWPSSVLPTSSTPSIAVHPPLAGRGTPSPPPSLVGALYRVASNLSTGVHSALGGAAGEAATPPLPAPAPAPASGLYTRVLASLGLGGASAPACAPSAVPHASGPSPLPAVAADSAIAAGMYVSPDSGGSGFNEEQAQSWLDSMRAALW